MSVGVFYNKVQAMPELGNKRRPPIGMPVTTSLTLNVKENGDGADASGGGAHHGEGTHTDNGHAGKEWNFLATLKNLKKWRRKARSVKLTAEENASRSPSEKSDVSSSSSGDQTIVDGGDFEVLIQPFYPTLFLDLLSLYCEFEQWNGKSAARGS